MRFFVVIPAAGIGTRMQPEIPKQYLKINQKTVLEHTLSKFLGISTFEKIIIALHPNDVHFSKLSISKHSKISTVLGGQTRQESVLNSLKYLNGLAFDNDWVLVHDAARPLINHKDILRLIDLIKDHPVGGILAQRMTNTIKQSDGKTIQSTINRNTLWQAQTPQMFKFAILQQAITAYRNAPITDESQAIELSGFTPQIVENKSPNIKITTPVDLMICENLLK